MPRLPWRWIVLGAAVLIATFGGYYLRREQRSDTLREEMLALHEAQLSEVASRYLAFRHRLEGLVHEAAQAGEPETWVDPRLNLAGLRAGDGLYLRLPIDAARDREQIPRAARGMSPDSILRCLGIPAMNARGLYESGEFLTPEWVEALREEESMMRLRVLEEQLTRHVQVDAPVVMNTIQADWFLLVLQQGDNRRDHPVDVYLWDLRRDRQLLRARIQARGILVPVRLRFEGAGAAGGDGPVDPTSGGANDCSIASQIRALAGGPAVEFESGDALVDPAAETGVENEEPTEPPPSEEAPTPLEAPTPEDPPAADP